MTGLPMKWHGKNQRSGLMSSSARMKPLSNSPPVSLISVMRSNISIGGAGSWAFPGPKQLSAGACQEFFIIGSWICVLTFFPPLPHAWRQP